MLEISVNVCLDIAEEFMAFFAERCVPFGFSIESVAIRKDEIEASIHMVNQIAEILNKKRSHKD